MRERLIYLVGAASQSGSGRQILAGLLHYLGAQAGLVDAVEASYRAAEDGRAQPYARTDTEQPLVDSVRAVQRILGWHRRDLGPIGRLHLLGWSLGGAVLFEAASGLLAADPAWRGAFASLVTLSSPINGSDVDGFDDLATVAAGEAGRDLSRRSVDPAHRERAQRALALLRDSGARVLTLGAADDAVVTPADSIVVPPGEHMDRYLLRPRPRASADFGERRLGHGALLHDPTAWRMILDTVRGEE